MSGFLCPVFFYGGQFLRICCPQNIFILTLGVFEFDDILNLSFNLILNTFLMSLPHLNRVNLTQQTIQMIVRHRLNILTKYKIS